jgi:hypothetical protein
MAITNINPVADVENDGWAIVGGDTSMWQALASNVDTNYLTSPGTNGMAMVSYPIDATAIPAGATIQSVSVAVRASLGAGTNTSANPSSFTTALVCIDDPSTYVQRTTRPTNSSASPATFTVANYRRDPHGNHWDIEGLNNIEMRVFSYNAISDLIRVYEMFLAVYYTAIPVVTVVNPAGNISTASPTISWTYRQTDGDFQASAEYKIFPATTVASPSFNPDISSPVFEGVVQGSRTSVQIPGSIPSNSYFFYVQSTSNNGAKSAWSFQQANVVAPSPGVPGVPDPSGNTPVGSGIVAVTPDYVNGCSILTVQDTSNLMSVHEADVTIDDTGARWKTVNCTVAESTDYLFPGDTNQVWKIVATANGDMSITTGFVPVAQASVGIAQQLTATGQMLAAVTGRTVFMWIEYFDANYNLLSTVTSTALADAAAPAWMQVAMSDTSVNQGAVYSNVTYQVKSAVASEAHYLTHAGLLYGNQTPFSSGGHASQNLLDSWYSNGQGTAPAGDSWVMSPGSTYASSTTFGFTGSGFDGTNINTMTYAGTSASIALRAVGTVFTDSSSNNTYTLNKPAGVTTNDLMVAFVTTELATGTTISVPAGWVLIDSSTVHKSSTDMCLFVLARTAGGSEPSTWSGTLSTSSVKRGAVVVAYSGAASISAQFISEAQSATATAGTVFTSPTVINTDPNAWRISVFSVNASSTPTITANTQAPGGNPIQYVGAAPAWISHDSTSTYTINRPANVLNGDLMIAAISCDEYAGTMTAPTGWTIVRQKVGSTTGGTGGAGQGAFMVLKRTAGSSEPASWQGTMASSSIPYPKIAECVAYRNCAAASSQFIADGIQAASYPTMWAPNVTNTNANAWQVAAFFSLSTGGENQIGARRGADINNSTQRVEDTYQSGDFGSPSGTANAVMMSDSNGPIPVGTVGGSATTSYPVATADAWVGIILPQTSIPGAPGNETSRATDTFGLAVFDSNGPVAAQPWSVTATSSTTFQVATSWVGLIKPSSASTGGLVSATLAAPIDLSNVDPTVLGAAGNQVTIGASFVGSSAGSTLITALFYRGPSLISQQTVPGGSFPAVATGTLTDCSAQFDIPDGTTRINMTLASPNHSTSDVVGWQRAFMNLGTDPSYRTGTAASAHPVWSYPQIQYADDPGDGSGFGAWQTVPGTQTNVPSFGVDKYLVFQDHTIIPLVSRKYRMRTVSFGLNGDVFTSPWSPDSNAMTFKAQSWWLKDIANPSNNIPLKVKWQDMKVTLQASSVQFQALGEKYPVVLTDGYKSDLLPLSMIPVNQEDHAIFMDLITSNRTLFLQSDIDQAWWVQCITQIDRTILATNSRKTNPLRQIDLTFVEVEPLP